MDRGDSLNLASPSSTDSEPASATMMKKKKKSKRAVSRRSAIESSGDSSSDDVIARPRPESKPKRTLVSSSSGDGSDPGVSGNPKKHVLLSSSVSSDNLVPSNDIPSTSRGIVHNTPSTSGSSSPIRIARKNLTSVIGSDTSTSSDVLVHPSRRVRHVLSESPSTSSNLQPMSTDDEDEGPRNFVLMNSKKNKLSSTESSGDEDCPSCAICLSSLANRIAAQISGCSHEFHNTCILKWSERTNTCPIDRSKFNKITVRNKQGEIVKVTDIDDTNAATADDDEPAFPDEAVNCMICNHPDNEDVLLLCDGCNRGYHIYCLNPPLARVPEGNWICEHCSPVISLPDSVYFNDALDISIEDYSDNSNPSDMDVSSNDSGEDQPSTSRRRRVGRYRSGSTLTVSVSSRNRNMLQSSRVRHTTITIKQTRKRKRRSTRRSRRRNVQNTVSQRSRIMAAAVAKRSAVACESGGGSVDRKHREKTLRSEPGRPRLSLFSSENFEDYYNPESDGEGEGGGVAVTARTRYPMSRVMDRKAAVARLINTNHRPRVAPRVTIPDSPNTTPSVNVLDDIMGMMEVEKKKSTGTVPIKKDGTFVVPARVDVNSDKNKEKVTETPGYPGGGMPHRPQSRYGSPAGNYQSSPGARHQSGVFSAQGTLPFTPRFSNNFPPGRSVDNFHMFRSPQPRFRSSLPRRFPARRSLPASLLMEPDGEHEDPAQPDEDVDIYGDIGSGPLLPPPQPPATLFAIAPAPEPPVGLLSSPPQPPAGLLSLGSPEEGPSDEEKGLVIDDEEYDPAAPCDSPGAETNAPSLPSDDDSSNSNNLTGIPVPDSSANSNDVGAIPVPHAGTKASATSSKNIPPLVNPSNIFSGKLDAFSLLDLSVKPSSTVEAIPIPKPSADNVSGIPIPEPTTVSSGSVNAIPITIQSDSDEEECPNSSLYSSTSLKLARKKSMDKDSSDNSDAEESPVKNNDSAQSVKSGPIRFSIGSKFSAKQKSNLFIDEEEDEDVEDEEKENDHDKERDNEKKKVEEDEAKEKVEGDKGGIVTYESSDEEKEGQENNISKNDVVKTVETEDILSDEEEVKKDQQEAEADDKLSDEEVNKKDEEDILSEEGNDKEGETDKLLDNEDDTPPRGKDKADSVDLEDSFEMSPDKARQDEENYLEDEILGSDKAEDNELDKDEVSTQGDILDLNTENLQGVTDVTVHDGTLQDTEDPNKSDSYNGLDGLDVDPVSNSEYGSLSDNADENGEKPEKKKKKKRKITEREEGEIVEPKKKDRKKDKDENNENGLSEKKSKKNKKDKESVEMSPLQEKTVSNNTDNFEQLMSSESIAWKKLSKNTKDRNYREKDELKGRKKKEGRKEIERYNVRKIVGEKALVRKDEFGRDISPQKSKSQSPNFGRSPRKRSSSPRKRSLSPRKRSLSPRKRSLSPRKRSLSPRKRSRSPRKRSLSRSKSPERRMKKWRSRSRSPDRFRNRSRSVSPRGRKRSPKSKERKPQKNRGRSGSRRRRSRTPRKQRSRSRSKPKKQNRAQLKNKQKIKSKPVETFKSKDGKKKKKKQVRSPSKTKPRSPRGRSPWDFSSTSISRSPSPPPPETYTRSRSWSREKNLTVIVPNMNKKKDKKKAKENRRRKHKDDNSPTLSKEVFTSGDNILVSVNFAHAEKPPPAEPTASKVEKVKAPVKRSKKDIAAMKAAKVREMAAKAKPVAIIDLDVSPFRERTPSPKEVIVLCDSDSENEAPPAKVQDLKAISSGPKTPPEPHIKFAISSKSQTINTIVNPLMDDEDKQGPNTPPEPPSPLPTSPYDPFDPTKSRTPSPTLQSAPSDNLEKAQSENTEKTQLDLLKPSSTPNKDSMQSPAKATSDEVVNLTLSKQEDKQVTSSLATTSQSSVPVYTPAMTTVARGNMNGGEALEDILNLDSDGVYSPGSSLGDDLFDPPKKSPPPSNVNTNKKFDSLFVSKNTSSKTIPYEPKLAKPLPPVGTPKKSAPPKYIPSKAKAKPVTMSKLDEDQLKILDEVPSSAVEMQVKYKYLKKLNRQERVVEEVKHVLKPHYNKKHVTKEQYKDILRKAVPKICHNKSGEINPMKITSLIEAYVKKYRVMNKRRTGGGGGNPANNTTNQHSNMNGAKKKSMWT